MVVSFPGGVLESLGQFPESMPGIEPARSPHSYPIPRPGFAEGWTLWGRGEWLGRRGGAGDFENITLLIASHDRYLLSLLNVRL